MNIQDQFWNAWKQRWSGTAPKANHNSQAWGRFFSPWGRFQSLGDSQALFCKRINCGPRGGTRRAKPGSGVQRFWGPLGASEFDPLFQKFGVSETPSQRPLRAPERLSGPWERLFRGLGEVCPFSKERGKKVGHSEAPKRLRFPGCPLRGFQPSGSYPQATDKSSAETIHKIRETSVLPKPAPCFYFRVR